MNVLVVSSKYPPEYSGSGHRAHRTYVRLKNHYDVQFEVLAGSVTAPTNRRYVYDHIPVHMLANPYQAPKRNQASRLLRRLIAGLRYRWAWQCHYWRQALPAFIYLLKTRKRFDLIHVFGNAPVTAAAATFAKIMHKPLIVELVNHKDDPGLYEPKCIERLFGKGFPSQALIVCLSDHLRRACLHHGYGEAQIWCRPNPIDENRFNCKTPQTTMQPAMFKEFDASDVVILHLAKFIPRKKQDFMIEVMARLPRQYKLVLAGPLVRSGPYKDRDHAYYQSILGNIQSHGLQDRVRLLPEFIDAPETYMKAADVFVLPAVDEAFGTPFLEAISCGKPSVVNDIPGVFDRWIEPGKNGFLCPLDPAQWADTIQRSHRISSQVLQDASSSVLQSTSTAVIDREYFQHLCRLTHNRI